MNTLQASSCGKKFVSLLTITSNSLDMLFSPQAGLWPDGLTSQTCWTCRCETSWMTVWTWGAFLGLLLLPCKIGVRERKTRASASSSKEYSGCFHTPSGVQPGCDSANQVHNLWDPTMATRQRALAKEILCCGDSPGMTSSCHLIPISEEEEMVLTMGPPLHSWDCSRV